MQKFIAGGCHINRDVRAILRAAGFAADELSAAYFEQMPRTHGYLYRGSVARA